MGTGGIPGSSIVDGEDAAAAAEATTFVFCRSREDSDASPHTPNLHMQNTQPAPTGNPQKPISTRTRNPRINTHPKSPQSIRPTSRLSAINTRVAKQSLRVKVTCA
jgi:hypothetical protein